MIEKLNYEIFEDVEIVNDGKKSFVLFLKAGKLAIRVSDKKFVFSEKAEHYLKTHSGINFYDKKWDIGLTYKTKNLSPETIKFVVLLNNK